MKKFYAFAFMLVSTLGLMAQSLSVTHSEEYPYGSSSDFLIQSHATIKNVGSSTIDVKVRRVEESIVNGSLNYFCWKNCYDPSVDVSPDFLTFGPGDEKSDFVADYEPSGRTGTSVIRYVFFDANNENDSASITVNYLATPVGIGENVWKVMDPYPNPAREKVVFEYTSGSVGNAQVVIYDLLGNVRKQAALVQGSNKLEMSVIDLEPGIYFYVLSLDDNTSITKKLVVSRD